MADALQLQMLSQHGALPIGGATNHTIDASNEAFSAILQANTTSAITHVGFRYGSRTGTPPTYRASLQSVDAATGFPSGTVLGGGSPASVTFTPPADTSWDGTWRKIALSNSYTPATREEFIALVVEYSSGTIDASNNASFSRAIGNTMGSSGGLPYMLTNTSGTWSKHTTSPVFAVYTSTETIGFPVVGAYSGTVSGASGLRIGMHFTMPSALMTSYVLRGFQAPADIGSVGSTVLAGVWDSSGTQQTITGSLDTDMFASGSAGIMSRFYFSSPPTLNAGTKYYIALQSGGTAAIAVSGIQLNDSTDRLAYPMGANRGLVTFNGTTWTEDNTVIPLMDLILDDITVPSGGGSIIVCGE